MAVFQRMQQRELDLDRLGRGEQEAVERIAAVVGDEAVDEEALAAFHALTRIEGIIPALESSHALAYAAKMAPTMDKDQIILVNLSGRGDKDIQTVAALEGISL